MKMRQRGYRFLLFVSLSGLAMGFAQAYAQAQKAKLATPSRSTASLTQGPWMQSGKNGAKIQIALPADKNQVPAGLQNPRSPASRARATGATTGGAQASQVFPAGGAGSAW